MIKITGKGLALTELILKLLLIRWNTQYRAAYPTAILRIVPQLDSNQCNDRDVAPKYLL